MARTEKPPVVRQGPAWSLPKGAKPKRPELDAKTVEKGTESKRPHKVDDSPLGPTPANTPRKKRGERIMRFDPDRTA